MDRYPLQHTFTMTEKLDASPAQIVMPSRTPEVRTSTPTDEVPLTLLARWKITALQMVEFRGFRVCDNLLKRRLHYISQSPLLRDEKVAWVNIAVVFDHNIFAAALFQHAHFCLHAYQST